MCKNKEELNELIEKKRKLTAEKKKIDSKLEEIDKDIIDYVMTKGTKGGKNNNTYIVFGDGYKASCIMITQHPFDSAKLKEFLGDRLADFQKTTIFPRLDIR